MNSRIFNYLIYKYFGNFASATTNFSIPSSQFMILKWVFLCCRYNRKSMSDYRKRGSNFTRGRIYNDQNQGKTRPNENHGWFGKQNARKGQASENPSAKFHSRHDNRQSWQLYKTNQRSERLVRSDLPKSQRHQFARKMYHCDRGKGTKQAGLHDDYK